MSGHNIPRQTIKSEREMEGREKKMMARKVRGYLKVGDLVCCLLWNGVADDRLVSTIFQLRGIG